MDREFTITTPSELEGLVIVEGKDEATLLSHKYPHLLKNGHGIHSLGGIGFAEAYLKSILRLRPGDDTNKLRKIALFIDADSNFTSSCQKVNKWLGLTNLPPVNFGALPNGILAGYFCLPDNNNAGALESLVFKACLVEPWLGLSQKYIQDAENAHINDGRQAFKLVDKRIMQAYLAGRQAEPPKDPYLCNGVGYAIKHGILEIQDESHFANIDNFLNDFIRQ